MRNMNASDGVLALGICLEEYDYPYPVQFFAVSTDLQPLKMAYMDVRPSKEPNGKTAVLFHGKAFGCYYFHNVIEALTASGYRVIAPDQIGWGKSPKPDIHYSFQALAANTAALLDHLGVEKVRPGGHPRLRGRVLRPPRPQSVRAVGAEDHVVPLGNYAKPEEVARLGRFVELSAEAARDIPRATRVVVPDCGHIPHLEFPDQFLSALMPFLAN